MRKADGLGWARRFFFFGVVSVSVVALLVGLPVAAFAHLGGVAQIARISETPQAVEANISQSVVPLISFGGSGPYVVLGISGEPYLRVTNDKIFLNANSPTAIAALNPLTRAAEPPGGPAPDPVWVDGGLASRRLWADPRMRLENKQRSRAWEFPVQFEGATRAGHTAVRGVTTLRSEQGHLVATLKPPAINDVEVKLLEGVVPAIFINNRSDATIEILGVAGEPFLKISREGVVANVASPTWKAAGSVAPRPDLATEALVGFDKGTAPRFETVSKAPIWSWLELRARSPVETYELLGSRRVIHKWETPLRRKAVDGLSEELTLKGSVEWVPATKPAVAPIGPTFPTWFPAAAVLLAVFGFTTLILKRRRARLSR